MITADINPDFPDEITLYNVPPNYKEVCNTIPGLNWKKKQEQWRCPLGWANCLALRATFGDMLTVGDNLNEWGFQELETRINPANNLREALELDGDPRLYPHQRAGVEFLRVAKQAILADDMGLGKSRTAFSAILSHYQHGKDLFPVLLVCPNSTKRGWKTEIEEVWPGLEVVVVDGTAPQRRKQLATPAHVYIINWEGLRSHSRLAPYGSIALKKCAECGGHDPKITEKNCHVHLRELNKMEFGAIIGDEIHRIKNPESQVTRALKSASGDTEIRLGLSGTPIADNPEDLWSILNWLVPQEYPSKVRWTDRMLDVTYDIYGNRHIAGVRALMKDEFFSALNPRIRRMPKDLVLDFLPPVVHQTRFVEMGAKQKKAYTQMRDLMLAELEGEDLVVTSPMVKTMRMLQFASSYGEASTTWVLDEETGEQKPKTHVTLTAPSNKIDAFMSDLEDYGDSQVVVFANSSQLIDLLSEKMTKEKINHGLITGKVSTLMRQEYMNDFQSGKLKYILCTTGAGGTGITLTAADTAVFLQRPWSMIDSQQAEARVRRIGSEIHDSITIVDYISVDTVDTVVLECIELKAERLQEILRDEELMKKVLKDNDAGLRVEEILLAAEWDENEEEEDEDE